MEMMKGMRKLVTVAVMVLLLMVEGSRAIGFCNMSDEGLMACKPAVTTDPNPPADPTQSCCEALSGADLTCLCSYKNSLLLPSLGIDPDLAMKLPAKCNLTTPADC